MLTSRVLASTPLHDELQEPHVFPDNAWAFSREVELPLSEIHGSLSIPISIVALQLKVFKHPYKL